MGVLRFLSPLSEWSGVEDGEYRLSDVSRGGGAI